MQRSLLHALALGAALLAAACSGGKASLHGRITEPEGPVEAAEVLILEPGSGQVVQRTLTGSGGKFAVRAPLASGSYVAEVRHPGYQTVRKTFTYPDTSSFEIRLEPQLAVQGTVLLPDRRPAASVRVLFKQDQSVRAEATTDAAGAYSVEGLVPGEYTVEAYSSNARFSYHDRHQLAGRRVQLDLVVSEKAKLGSDEAGESGRAPVDSEPSGPAAN